MKKERNLLKLLTDNDCLIASKEVFENANIHKQSAEVISNKGLYGIAVSHLILSTEELVKGLLLYIQHLSIDVRNVPSVYLFFSDHIIRHRLAATISLMYPMLKLFMGFIYKAKEKLHNPKSQIEYTDEEKALISKDERKIQHLFQNLPEMIDWWDEANMNKNKGFYVDYSQKLDTPMQITELEYKQALTIVDNFQRQILDIVAYFEKATEEDKKEIANKKELYKIDKILAPIIEARKNEMKNKDKNPLVKLEQYLIKDKIDKNKTDGENQKK